MFVVFCDDAVFVGVCLSLLLVCLSICHMSIIVFRSSCLCRCFLSVRTTSLHLVSCVFACLSSDVDAGGSRVVW